MNDEIKARKVDIDNFSSTEIEEDLIIYQCNYCEEEYFEPEKVRSHISDNHNTSDKTKPKKI